MADTQRILVASLHRDSLQWNSPHPCCGWVSPYCWGEAVNTRNKITINKLWRNTVHCSQPFCPRGPGTGWCLVQALQHKLQTQGLNHSRLPLPPSQKLPGTLWGKNLHSSGCWLLLPKLLCCLLGRVSQDIQRRCGRPGGILFLLLQWTMHLSYLS